MKINSRSQSFYTNDQANVEADTQAMAIASVNLMCDVCNLDSPKDRQTEADGRHV